MAELTDEQIDFLEHHNIPLERVFDASGMRRAAYREAMREVDAWVAFGVTPCQREGHTLRTRRGDCFQCNPAGITWTRKQDLPGLIYVAWSERARLTKVGVTDNTRKRIGLLNTEGYGGAWDWKLTRAWEIDRAGKVETAVHGKLAAHATAGRYLKNGVITECRELFECSTAHAVEVIMEIINPAQKRIDNVVPIPIPERKNTSRPRMLPTTVALHVVHQGLKLAGKSDNGLSDREIRLIRNLAESILSAISCGLRDQVVNVSQDCIDAYQELDKILDDFEETS